jgi:hypothetical protein
MCGLFILDADKNILTRQRVDWELGWVVVGIDDHQIMSRTANCHHTGYGRKFVRRGVQGVVGFLALDQGGNGVGGETPRKRLGVQLSSRYPVSDASPHHFRQGHGRRTWAKDGHVGS